MIRKRPASATTIAILQFIFGGITVLGLLFELGSLAMQGGRNANAPAGQLQRILETEAPGYNAFHYGSLVVNAIVVAIQITSGVLLLRMHRSGPTLAIIYAIVDGVVVILSSIYTIAYIQPAMSKFVLQGVGGRGANQMAGFVGTITSVGTIIGAVFSLTYVTIVVILMTRPQLKAAIASGGLVDDDEREDERYDEDDEDERRPRRRRDPSDEDRFRGGSEDRYQ